MAGYFRVPMEGAKFAVANSDSPELLAAYLVMCSFTFGHKRQLTAAGANAIKKGAGVTDWRSKRLLADLYALRCGDRGEQALVIDIGRARANSTVKQIPEWDGIQAYVPALFVRPTGEYVSPLIHLIGSAYPPRQKRDALLLILHLYASTDYGGWMGAPPDMFPYQVWDSTGHRTANELDVELGEGVGTSNVRIWTVGAPTTSMWFIPTRTVMEVFGDAGEETRARLLSALMCLIGTESVCKVTVVSSEEGNYPLWVASPGYRETLARNDVHGDLAAHFHNLAMATGDDADNWLMIECVRAKDDIGPEGTGIYFCGSRGGDVAVRTLLLPRFHAPTPINLDGLREMSVITNKWVHLIDRERRFLKQQAA